MKFLATIVLFISLVSLAQAEAIYSIGGGLMINQNDSDEKLGGEIDEELSASLNLGTKALYDINENLHFRTGLYLQERSFKYSVDMKSLNIKGDVTGRIISTSIPLNLQYKLNDKMGVFGGYTLDYNLNDYCKADGDFDSCSLEANLKQIVHYANVGISIWGNDKLDVDISYQRALTDTYNKLQIHSFLAQLFVKI